MHALRETEDLQASNVMLGSSAVYLVLLSCFRLHCLCWAFLMLAPMSLTGIGCPDFLCLPTKKFFSDVGNSCLVGSMSLAKLASLSASSFP